MRTETQAGTRRRNQ